MVNNRRFWLWWPIAGMVILSASFLWFMSPIALGFRPWPTGTRLEIADGIFRFSYFIVNPSMVILWLALPWFHGRELTSVGWKLLGFVALLLVGCIAAVLTLV